MVSNLKYQFGLGEIDLVPEVQITVRDYSPFDENLSVLIMDQEQPIVVEKCYRASICDRYKCLMSL